jgi:hypothetical protein
MKRKALSLLLALAMILTFMPAMAFAEDSVPGPAKVEISATDDNSIMEPVTAVLAFKNDAKAEVTVKASRLIASGDRTRNISFTLKAVESGGWEAGSTTGVYSWGTFNKGETVTFTVNVNDISTDQTTAELNFKQVIGETVTEGIIKFNFDFTKTDVFNSTNNPRDTYFANPDNLNRWSNGTDPNFITSKDPENNNAWKKMKAEDAAAKFIDEYNAAVKAKKDADASKAAAEAAMKTPGDAAVAAAQKALDDSKKAEKAAKNLGKALDTLENIDKLYINNASQIVPEDAAALKDAQEITTTSNYDALEAAVSMAEARLSEAKAEVAEVKANTAAAEAAALRYTPAQAKIKSVKAGKKKATVRFKKVSKNVTGYEIQITDKNTGAVVKTVYAKKSKKKVIKKTVKGLSKKTKYTAMVRAYNTVDGKTYYGAWSKAKGFKTRK